MHNHDPEKEKLELEALETAKKNKWEGRDLDFVQLGKGINGFFIFTMVLIPVSFVFMFGIQFMMGIDRKPFMPMVDTTKNAPKLAPLQNNVTVWKDMQDLRVEEHKMTTTYGVNPDGKTRIPTDRAMEIVAQKGSAGLSAQTNMPVSPTTPVSSTNP